MQAHIIIHIILTDMCSLKNLSMCVHTIESDLRYFLVHLLKTWYLVFYLFRCHKDFLESSWVNNKQIHIKILFQSNSLIWFPLTRHELFDKSDKSMSIISNPSFKAVGYQWVCLSVCLFVSYLFYAKKTLKIPPMTSRLNNSI